MLRKDLLADLEGQPNERPHWNWQTPEGSRERFLARCERLSASIREEVLKKGVVISFLHAVSEEGEPCQGPNADELRYLLAQALRSHEQRGGWLYGAWDGSSGILGISPETLFERRGRAVKTHALAGTQKWGDSSVLPLLEDPKERAEHQWVIEGIRESLMGLGVLKVGSTGFRRAGDLVHLHAEIDLDLNREVHWPELIKRLHPTPALGAYPRGAEGTAFLENQEAECPRGRFGAPFGFVFPDHEVFVVGIRNLEWSRAQRFCRIGAGAGFVAASHPEKEWAEVGRKWLSVRRILALEGHL